MAFAISVLLGTMPAEALDALKFGVAGNDKDLQSTLVASSSVVEARRAGTTDPNDLLAAARADYSRLVGALYSRGRFGGIVSITFDGREAADIDPLETLTRIGTIQINVWPGPLYRFSRAEITPLATGTELPEGFARGQPAFTTVIEDAAGQAVDGWRGDGYAKADIASEDITADHARDTLDAVVRVAPGPKLRFGQLVVNGDSRVTPKRVREIAGLPNGEVFNPDDVRRSARRLRETGVFQTVTVTEADTPNADGTLDIIAELSDQKKRRYGFGAELDSSDGLTLSAFWLHRNLLGGAERLRFDAEVSGIGGSTGGTDYSLGVEIGRPGTPNAKTDAFAKAKIEHLDEPTYTSDNVSIGLGFNREINDIASTRYGIEYHFSDVTDATGKTQYRQFFFPLGGTYDKRDNALNTTEGYYIDLGISPFVGIGGSESGARLTFDTRGFVPFGKDKGVVLAGRLQGGSIVGASVTGLPNDLRFTSGGGGTVRGQDYQSLDLDIGGGVRSGGRSFIGIQSEVRTQIADSLQLVGFYDWAMIGPDSFPGSGTESHSGAGLGLRYETGIGPIRFDIGVPVSGPGTNSGFQIYIGIGQAF